MPVNPRRQTLAGAQAKPPPLPSSSKPSSSAGGVGGIGGISSNGSVGSSSSRDGASAPRRRVPMSRKSMIPRCAGPPSASTEGFNANRENNGRAAAAGGGGGGGSGIVAPSPSRPRHARPPSAMRKSLGGAILQHGQGDGNAATSAASSSSFTPAKNRRVSLAPTASSSSSSSSSMAAVPGSSSNVDPRDVRDRSYLQSAIRKMVSYLTSRGYADASSLNVKQLVNSGPSGRDFQNIMTFLFRRVDPTFHSTPSSSSGPINHRTDEVVLKFEDEVSMAFRCLGYPFPISKTGLVAVGSPHTWPALIAAIDWLVDVLTIRDEEDPLDWVQDETTGGISGQDALSYDESVRRVRMQFHQFLRKGMVAFLNGDNDECEELEGALLDTFQKDNERIEVYLTGLDDECGRIREEIASLNQEVNG